MKRFTKTELTNTVMKVVRATFDGPVVITDRGSDSHVLMTVEDYESLLGKSIADVDVQADDKSRSDK